mmetsp:Transcript_17908/g.26501  ORF Transcript_17908/g.26501 Transcript_17908/m.26501 type:complete len:647 (-) Transcript_17908:1938-3878(-)
MRRRPQPLGKEIVQVNNLRNSLKLRFKSERKSKQRNQLWTIAIIIIFVIVINYLVVFLYRRFSQQWMKDPLVTSLLEKTPKTKNGQYIVFVTMCNGRYTDVKHGKSSKSAFDALQRAYSSIKSPDARKIGRTRSPLNKNPLYIKVDAIMSIESKPKFNYAEEKPPPRAGFAIGDWSSMAFLYEQVVGSTLIDRNEKIRWDNIGKLWGASSVKEWPSDIHYEDFVAPLDFFRTQAIFVDNKQKVVNLYKGHNLFHELTPELLYESARMAGDYLARQTHIDGTMVFRYRPRSDTEPDDDYNLARHAGTAYSIASLYSSYKSPELLSALKASLDYLVNQKLVVCPIAYLPGQKAKCVMNEYDHGSRWTHLGANALTLLAMVEYLNSTQDVFRYLDSIVGLAAWISGAQHEDGSFVQYQEIDTNQLDENSFVRDCPGEATFAMARLHHVASSVKLKDFSKDRLQNWKAVVSGALDFLVERESKVDDDDFVIDHWVLYAIAEIDRWYMTKGITDFVYRTGQIAQQRQVRQHDNDDNLDKNGIYLHKGVEDAQSLRSYGTATKTEGLCAVYSTMLMYDPEMADMFLESVKWGMRYQLQTQFRPEQAMYMKAPDKVIGAFRKSIDETETQNDYTQHNLSSLLCLARILEAQSS